MNKCFENKLHEDLRQKNKELISVETCPLHTVSNVFLEDLKRGMIPEINLNQFAIDLHNFKYFAKKVQKIF